MKRFIKAFFSVIIIFILLFVFKTDMAQTNNYNEYIIGFHDYPDKALIQQAEGDIVKEFSLINAVLTRMPSDKVTTMFNRPDIKYIELNQEVFSLQQEIPWGIDRVFYDEDYYFNTWEYTKGRDIDIAVLDTGIDENHNDLPELSGGVNTIDNTHWGQDDHGHGTAITGVIAALDNDIGVVGVAPEVNIYSVKVLNEAGGGNTSSIIAGIEWAVENNIPILNMSLGMSSYSEALKEAVDNAYNKGHLLVAAAGNDGEDSGLGDNVRYPAKYQTVIAVAASNDRDQRANFSSTGEDVELIAPGENILTTIPDNSFDYMNGTSLAAPMVTGAAALTWSYNESLSNDEIRLLLQKSTEDLGLSKSHQGYGLVRPDKLLAKLTGINKLDNPFELKFYIEDLAGDPFISKTEVTVIFKDLNNNQEEIHKFDEVNFYNTEGTISWNVGTKDNNDIILTNLDVEDINEIIVKSNNLKDTLDGLNE